jgi:hypothetical protein
MINTSRLIFGTCARESLDSRKAWNRLDHNATREYDILITLSINCNNIIRLCTWCILHFDDWKWQTEAKSHEFRSWRRSIHFNRTTIYTALSILKTDSDSSLHWFLGISKERFLKLFWSECILISQYSNLSNLNARMLSIEKYWFKLIHTTLFSTYSIWF